MLMIIDKALRMYPSRFMNWISCGQEGSSLCARCYLYQRCVSHGNWFVNFIVWSTDIIEPGHCIQAARMWRIRVKKTGEVYPTKYISWFKTQRNGYEHFEE